MYKKVHVYYIIVLMKYVAKVLNLRKEIDLKRSRKPVVVVTF